MKLSILNECLSKDSVIAARLIFPPIVLLVAIETGIIVSPNEHNPTTKVRAHYSTLIYNVDTNEPNVFEFDIQMLKELQGYASRYNNLGDVELLFSREEDGRLRVTMGRKSDLESSSELVNRYANVFNKLADKYLAKTGYKVNDF